MSVLDVIAKVRRAGGTVTVDGQELVVKAPTGTLAADDRVVLAEYKPMLLNLLREDASDSAWVDNLHPAKAEQVVGDALAEWRQIVAEGTYSLFVDAETGLPVSPPKTFHLEVAASRLRRRYWDYLKQSRQDASQE